MEQFKCIKQKKKDKKDLPQDQGEGIK